RPVWDFFSPPPNASALRIPNSAFSKSAIRNPQSQIRNPLMPEQPPPKRQPVTEPDSKSHAAQIPRCDGVAYAELHCRTNFSFLEGASHPDELVQTAANLKFRALAITDRNSLAGVVRAHAAAKSAGLPLLIGAEVTPLDAPPVVLLA